MFINEVLAQVNKTRIMLNTIYVSETSLVGHVLRQANGIVTLWKEEWLETYERQEKVQTLDDL